MNSLPHAVEEIESPIGPKDAYEFMLQRQFNEDRLVTEGKGSFYLGTSFLMVSFVMLLDQDLPTPFHLLRIMVPVLGIMMSLLLYGVNRAAANALHYWHRGQQKIEEESLEMAYLRDNCLAPHTDGADCVDGAKKWEKKDDSWVLQPLHPLERWIRKPLLWRRQEVWFIPGAFGALWTTSLVLSIINHFG